MSEPEPLVINRHQLLAEAHEAYGYVRQAYERDRHNPELALKACQAASALSLLMTDCTPRQPDPLEQAAKEAQAAVLNEIAAAFKGVYCRMESTLMDETDGVLIFEVNVLYMGEDPDLVRLTLGQAGGALEGPFVTRKAVEAVSMARSLTAAGAVVGINVINPTASAPSHADTSAATEPVKPVEPDEASGAAEDVNGAPVEPAEATSAAPGDGPVDPDADDGAEISADDDAAAAAELGEE